MIIYSLDKPVTPFPRGERELEAVGVELLKTDMNDVCFLLVRYYSLNPIEVEGDHLFLDQRDLLEDLVKGYGVSLNRWYSGSNYETTHIRFFIKKYIDNLKA